MQFFSNGKFLVGVFDKNLLVSNEEITSCDSEHKATLMVMSSYCCFREMPAYGFHQLMNAAARVSVTHNIRNNSKKET